MPRAVAHGRENSGLDAQPVKTINAVNTAHVETSESVG
jgi:hypothetical protein